MEEEINRKDYSYESICIKRNKKRGHEIHRVCIPVSRDTWTAPPGTALGILTVQLADYMKVMLTVVMGAMFLVFLVVGIQSLRQYQSLKTQSEKEQDLENEIKKWFSDHYDASEWDNFVSDEANLYYERYEKMESMIRSAYPDLEETFLDHLIEELYADFFEENLN